MAIALSGDFGWPVDRLTVRDSRFVEFDVEVVVSHESIFDHFEVEFPHAGNDGLARFGAFACVEGWILTLEHVEDFGEFLAFGGVFRLDRHGDNRLGELDRWQLDHLSGIAERIAGDRIARSDRASDIAAFEGIDLALSVPFRGVDLPELSDIFFFVAIGVIDSGVGLKFPRINADPKHIAGFGREDFEDQGAERVVRIGFAEEFFIGFLRIAAFDCRAIQGAGQVSSHAIEEGLDTYTVQG